MMTYENRIVTYIDLLGFKRLIKSKLVDSISDAGQENPWEYDEVVHALTEFRRITTFQDKQPLPNPPMITHFSDCVVISFDPKNPKNKGDVLYHIKHVQALIYKMANLRVNLHIPCRGAIVFGKIMHTPEILFGPGLIDAYEMERCVAKFPRVIIDDNVIDLGVKNRPDDFTESGARAAFESICIEDDDGKKYIDYTTRNGFLAANPRAYGTLAIRYFESLRDMTDKMLKDEDTRVREKGEWIKNKLSA
jgi:hypothetical protein